MKLIFLILGQQQWTCRCGKMYPRKASYQMHWKFDCDLTRKKTYYCAICSQRLKRKFDLKRHLAVRHEIYVNSDEEFERHMRVVKNEF